MSHTKNFHNTAYDEGTKCKLDLYTNYLRAWLPTFINNPYVEHIQIFDFFAGPGTDGCGNPGSPLLAAQEIRNAIDANASRMRSTLDINFHVNELKKEKFIQLQATVRKIRAHVPEISVHDSNRDFASLFQQNLLKMRAPKTANFIFIDQFGLKEVTEDIFKTLIDLPKTDFMFYLAAAAANRFKNIESVIKCIPPIMQEEKDRMNGDNVLRILCDAYERHWIPSSKNYFLGNFSIKKQANVYGLIFGSAHPKGIDKFLREAWKLGGDANFDIDHDGFRPGELSLFPELTIPSKIREFQDDLEKYLRTKPPVSNKWLYVVGLKCGMLSSHVRPVVTKLKKEGFITNSKVNISYGAWEKPEKVQLTYTQDDSWQGCKS